MQEFAYRRIHRLRIHTPPRSGKSNLFSICWPAWVWTFNPRAQFIYLSYANSLSTEHSIKCRRIIESPWYRETFGTKWSLLRDQNVKHDFGNTAGGRRFATSIGGSVLGRGGDFVMLDDPLNTEDAFSPSIIEHTNRVVSEMTNTRLNNPKTGGVAMAASRVAINDPAMMLPDAEVLSLPVEMVMARRSITYHWAVPTGKNVEVRTELWRDPREHEGQILNEERWPSEFLERMKKPPNSINVYNAQYMQEPRSFEGGMFKRGDWRFYQINGAFGETVGRRPEGCTSEPAAPRPAAFVVKVLTMDCAFKDNPAGSRVAIHVWGLAGVNRYLLYRHTAHLDFVASKQALRSAYASHPDCTRYLVEDAANGPAIISELKHEIPKLIGIPAKGSKGARAAAGQPYQQAHNCFLPDGSDGIDDFVSSTASFVPGNDKNSDDVDAFSMAMMNMDEQPDGEVGRVDWKRR